MKNRKLFVLALIIAMIASQTCLFSYAEQIDSSVDNVTTSTIDQVTESESSDVEISDNNDKTTSGEDQQEEEKVGENQQEDISEDTPPEETPEEIKELPVVGAVTGLKLKWISSSAVTLTWSSAGKCDGYKIYKSKEKTSKDAYKCIGTVKSGSKLTYTDKGLSKKTIYLYKVCAYTDAEDICVQGKYSSTVKSGTVASKIPVITYHRLCADSKFKYMKQGRSLFVPAGTFKKQMKYLRDKGYRTISAKEFADWYDKKIELPKKVVLITFDDGNYSVIKYGLPILKKYNQKATIFMIGKDTKATTTKKKYARDSYRSIGKDVMKSVQASYPKLEFQSHTYALHTRVKGKKPVLSFSQEKLYADTAKQYNNFQYTILAYPWGTTSSKMIAALKQEGHTRVAFTYGTNAYARRTDNRYKVKRIKISGTQSFKEFTRWF